MNLRLSIAVGLTVAAIALAAFLYIVRRRAFARFRYGFLFALIAAVAGVSFATASLLGAWAYGRGRIMLFQALVGDMNNIAAVLEEENRTDLAAAHAKLLRVAAALPTQAAQETLEEIKTTMREIQRVDPRFLDIKLTDNKGQLLLTSSTSQETERLDRIAVAYGLEGNTYVSGLQYSPIFKRYVFYLTVPMRDDHHIVVGVLAATYDIQEDLADLLGAAHFGKSGYAVLVDQAGHIVAHPDASRLQDDISAYPAVRAALRGETGWVIDKNKAGMERFFSYRPVQSPATVDPKPLVLLTEIDAREVLAPIHALSVEFAVRLFAALLICLLVARQVAISIGQPVKQLVQFVRKVRDGDLTQRTAISGRDEMGQLATALNEMVQGLQERDRVKEVFGRYVTTQISERILASNLNLGGERRRVTMLFSDIRDFTAMSESMPPEEVVGFLNDYFSEMVDAVFEQTGVLDKFIGDGMLAVFGSLEEMPDHPRRAVLAALRMKALVAKINGERAAAGHAPIAIGIGIHTDDVIVGNIGSRKRLEYTVIGDGVNTCSRVESLNKNLGTTILITETTYAELGDGFVCRPMPEALLKGKTRVPKIFEVISRAAPGRVPPPTAAQGASPT